MKTSYDCLNDMSAAGISTSYKDYLVKQFINKKQADSIYLIKNLLQKDYNNNSLISDRDSFYSATYQLANWLLIHLMDSTQRAYYCVYALRHTLPSFETVINPSDNHKQLIELMSKYFGPVMNHVMPKTVYKQMMTEALKNDPGSCPPDGPDDNTDGDSYWLTSAIYLTARLTVLAVSDSHKITNKLTRHYAIRIINFISNLHSPGANRHTSLKTIIQHGLELMERNDNPPGMEQPPAI